MVRKMTFLVAGGIAALLLSAAPTSVMAQRLGFDDDPVDIERAVDVDDRDAYSYRGSDADRYGDDVQLAQWGYRSYPRRYYSGYRGWGYPGYGWDPGYGWGHPGYGYGYGWGYPAYGWGDPGYGWGWGYPRRSVSIGVWPYFQFGYWR